MLTAQANTGSSLTVPPGCAGRQTGGRACSIHFLADAPTACSSSSRVTTGSSIKVPRGVLAAFAATAAAAASSSFEGVLGRSGTGSGSGCDADAAGAALRAGESRDAGGCNRAWQCQINRCKEACQTNAVALRSTLALTLLGLLCAQESSGVCRTDGNRASQWQTLYLLVTIRVYAMHKHNSQACCGTTSNAEGARRTNCTNPKLPSKTCTQRTCLSQLHCSTPLPRCSPLPLRHCCC